MRRKAFLPLLLLVTLAGAIVFLSPITIDIYASLKAYNARVANSYDYTKFTTPMSANAVVDICAKFELSLDDERCQSGATAYAPDFFEDIKSYFDESPRGSVTLQLVQDKLGSYQIGCEAVNNNGNYRCRYDLRGDGRYPIFIYFSEKDVYYRIIANTGGS
jgi:hypothetical protein